VFNELAITSYFGGRVVSNATNRDQLLAAINNSDTEATALVYNWLLDPNFPSSIPSAAASWAKQVETAHKSGLKLTNYEGGQHVHHMAFLTGITKDQELQLRQFLTKFVRSEEMAALYSEAWKTWAAIGDGPFMQFVEIGSPSKWGSWGLYSHLGDSNPRSRLLEWLNASSEPWW
jgi:hypothetical protein